MGEIVDKKVVRARLMDTDTTEGNFEDNTLVGRKSKTAARATDIKGHQIRSANASSRRAVNMVNRGRTC